MTTKKITPSQETTQTQTQITDRKKIFNQLGNLHKEINEVNEAYHEIKNSRLKTNDDDFEEYTRELNKKVISEMYKLNNINTKLKPFYINTFEIVIENYIRLLSFEIIKVKTNLLYEFDLTRWLPESMTEDRRQQIANEFFEA